MLRCGSQVALDGNSIALLTVITYFCQAAPPYGEERAQSALLLFITRMIESLDSMPRCLAEFQAALQRALASYPEMYEGLETYIKHWFLLFDNVDGLTELFHAKLPECLYDPQEEVLEGAQLLDRRSYLGLFVRRARLAFEMLLDLERLQLAAKCGIWRSDSSDALFDEWRSNDKAKAYLKWWNTTQRGDYEAAKNELHAFFDLTLPGCDQDLHQHALLNLAKFHMDTDGYSAARTTLNEAILLARTAGDTECMQACDHLLQQLTFLDSKSANSHSGLLTRRELDSQLNSGAYAPLTLWKADQYRQRGKPLLSIVQMLADAAWRSRSSTRKSCLDWEPRPSIERSAACPSAVLAQTWLQIGVWPVAESYIHHIDCVGQSKPAWRELRLTAFITKSYAEAESGEYVAAIYALTQPKVLECISSMAMWNTWQTAIWHVVNLRARRQNHTATLRHIESVAPDLPLHHQQLGSASEHMAVHQFKYARKAITTQLLHQDLDEILKSIATAEQQNWYPLQRQGLALLAKYLMDSSPDDHQAINSIFDEILPASLADFNVERRGYIQFFYSTMRLAVLDFEGASRWLQHSEKGTLPLTDADFAQAQNFAEQAACLYLLARIADQLKDPSSRSSYAQAYIHARQLQQQAASSVTIDASLPHLHTLISAVGRRFND
ncbi:hypothetical protein MPSI1_001331 [Malassezia psittaci]|uniref:Anaphase-promoting complex subunit 5 n=1 Tax=Malassezia psittaci TaxID=1821823 RepID=A0AAF0FD78_9BASI|nr:hypothetical protein MPSI1_001331 [Malassezia psittaci]